MRSQLLASAAIALSNAFAAPAAAEDCILDVNANGTADGTAGADGGGDDTALRSPSDCNRQDSALASFFGH
ncbi:hypothetical protein [Sphingomicrobium flavum]|uniref:hypothetical protein n=1 Tax=Sphingomicrobium flavum TaxID=1229164 RepID=UPI0021AE10DF|nr:hypothetical protein [Sphingomicrobium flavum]